MFRPIGKPRSVEKFLGGFCCSTLAAPTSPAASSALLHLDFDRDTSTAEYADQSNDL